MSNLLNLFTGLGCLIAATYFAAVDDFPKAAYFMALAIWCRLSLGEES